jgi:RHS repeat-associated protein
VLTALKSCPMPAQLHATPTHALPRERSRARGCKTASKKKFSFSRFNPRVLCAPAQAVPRENALFPVVSTSGKTVGEYGNGGATSTGRTEYIWLPTDDGSAIPIALFRNNRYYNIHSDHLGTPRIVTDDQAKPVWQWAYSAFGDSKPTGILKATTNPNAAITNQPVLLQATGVGTTLNLRFPGQYADSETGLFYNYFRSYQATQGRYTQNDPIGLAGGWNRFGYGYQNSLSYTDPEGLLNSQVQDWLNQTRPDLSKCATAECKAGLLPTPKANPTACEMRCGTGSDDWAGRSLICGSIAAGGKLIGIPGIPVTLGCKIIDKRACIKKCEEESDPICRRD